MFLELASRNVDTGAIADFDADTPGVQPDGTLAYATDDINAGVDPNITAGGMFYGVNLATGEATSLSAIGDGNTRLVGLATAKVPEPATVMALIGFGAIALRSRRQTA